MAVAKKLMLEVRDKRPDLYQSILDKIRPHSMHAVLCHLESHLQRVDLSLFNQHRDNIPDFVWTFVNRLKFPVPGDPFGIYLTCRVTKSDTQGTLDSKHLQQLHCHASSRFNVHKAVLDELALFSTQIQVFEIANRHEYATVFLRPGAIEPDALLNILPLTGYLERGAPHNMARDARGKYRYLSAFHFLVVEDRGSLKILYQTSRDLNVLMRFLCVEQMVAFSDVRYIFQKCGIVCFYFNMMQLVKRQLLMLGDESTWTSVYARDVATIVKFQCRSGRPLPLTRDGLAKNPDRTPLEVLSFEAPKKNYTRLGTQPQGWIEVETSADKIFFGQQFNEGTGYDFAVLPAK